MSKISPAPWRGDSANAVYDANDNAVACIFDHNKDADEAKANTRLIETAPDLLDALKSAEAELSEIMQNSDRHDYLDDDDDCLIPRLKAVIAKAAGDQ